MTDVLSPPPRPPRTWPALLLIAAVITGLNAFKPLTMDDSAYAEYARQIAHHPFDPYGFQVFWSQWPEPANWLLAPPVLPYWWAVAMRWFGPSVVVWKLWLFPWVAAFVFAVHALLKRFAPSVALPMTVFTVFAPVFLPAINYMLDVPALGLGLAGLCVSMRATDRRSIGLAALAGIMFGLALQTKYTVATLPLVAAVYGLSRRRLVFAVVPGFIAAGLFAGWEAFVAHTYGRSHFLLHLGGPDLFDGKQQWYYLISGAGTLMGALAGPLALLVLLAIGVGKRWLLAGGAVLVAAFAIGFPWPGELVVFGAVGLGVSTAIAFSLHALLRRATDSRTRQDDLFLFAWFATEVAASLAMSPFVASRRLMGVLLVLSLIAARLLNRRPDRVDFPGALNCVIGFNVALGALFFAVDWVDASAERSAAQTAAALIDALRVSGQRAYFLGHWGMQFYCEAAGLEPLVPDHTLLRSGDWLVYPHSGVDWQLATLMHGDVFEVRAIDVNDALPLSTIPGFYGRMIAMKHRTGPRISISVYQMKNDAVLPTASSPEFIVKWAITRPGLLMPMSITAVLRAARDAPADQVALVERKIVASGRGALLEAAQDPNPRWRDWAAAQLRELR